MITSLVAYARTLIGVDEGATALEYAILVARIALVIIVGVTAFGRALNTFFNNISDAVPF